MQLPRVVVKSSTVRRGQVAPNGSEKWSSTFMYPIGWSPDNFRKVVLLEGDHCWEMGRNNVSSWCSTRLLVLLVLLLFSMNTLMYPEEFSAESNSTEIFNDGDLDIISSPPTGWSSWSSFDESSEEPVPAPEVVPEVMPEVMPELTEVMPSIPHDTTASKEAARSSGTSEETTDDDTTKTRVTAQVDSEDQKKKYRAGAFTGMLDDREKEAESSSTKSGNRKTNKGGSTSSSTPLDAESASSVKNPNRAQKDGVLNFGGVREGHDPLDDLESREMMLRSVPTLFVFVIGVYVFFSSSRSSNSGQIRDMAEPPGVGVSPSSAAAW